MEEPGECGEQELNAMDSRAILAGSAAARNPRAGSMEAPGIPLVRATAGRVRVFEVWMGDLAELSQASEKSRSFDRRSRLLLRADAGNNFPQIWVPGPENRITQLCGIRHRMVQMRTRIMNQLQALA